MASPGDGAQRVPQEVRFIKSEKIPRRDEKGHYPGQDLEHEEEVDGAPEGARRPQGEHDGQSCRADEEVLHVVSGIERQAEQSFIGDAEEMVAVPSVNQTDHAERDAAYSHGTRQRLRKADAGQR